MLIIFGWRNRASAVSSGMFMCPHCGADRSYEFKRVRRWFTLFFLPVIPLNHVGEFVECGTCRTRYASSVLTAPTTSALRNELAWAIREAVAELLRVTPAVDVHLAAAPIVAEFMGEAWTPDQQLDDVHGLDTRHLYDRLRSLSTALNEQGKERFLTTCARVCTTADSLNPEQRGRLDQIASGLLVTPVHLLGIIEHSSHTANQ